MSTRHERIERLISIRMRAVQRAEVEVAALSGELTLAERRVAEALAAWHAATRVGTTSECLPVDLVAAYEYAISLGRHHEARLREAQAASAKHEAARGRMQDARVALRKLELWRDRVIEQERGESLAAERRQTDEIAAQRRRTG